MPRLHQHNLLRATSCAQHATCCGQQASCCAQQVACYPQQVACYPHQVAYCAQLDACCPQQVVCCAQHATCCAQQASSCAQLVARNLLCWCKRGITQTHCSWFHHFRPYNQSFRCICTSVRCTYRCHNGTDRDYMLHIRIQIAAKLSTYGTTKLKCG